MGTANDIKIWLASPNSAMKYSEKARLCPIKSNIKTIIIEYIG